VNEPAISTTLAVIVTTLASGTRAAAAFVTYDSFESWASATNEFTTIAFDDLPLDTFVSDQYSSLGAVFPDGNDFVVCCSLVTYPLDGAGLNGNGGPINIEFTSPVNWIGVHFPGSMKISLYNDGSLVYSSGLLGGSGANFFAGVVSTMPFDRAILVDLADNEVSIDNLYFGTPIPAPPAMAFLLLGLGPGWRRRRG